MQRKGVFAGSSKRRTPAAENSAPPAISRRLEIKRPTSERKVVVEEEEEPEKVDGRLIEGVFEEYERASRLVGGNFVEETRKARESILQTVDCVACMSRVKADDPVWQCRACFLVMHIVCLQRWARASAARPVGLSEQSFPLIVPTWRCPKCRCEYASAECPTEYRCWCGKVKDPPADPWKAAHSCGEICGRRLVPDCGHKCVLRCHPGACSACPQTVRASCFCGATKQQRRCGDRGFSCGGECGKLLNCRVHSCKEQCHAGSCQLCSAKKVARCACGKKEAEVPCHEEAWSCGTVCGRKLACGHHSCEKTCHSGDCGACPLSGPRSCHCGKETMLRIPCDKPTPSCGQICDKVLANCQFGHKCPEICHARDCPPCPMYVEKRCRCHKTVKNVLCSAEFLCDKKCTKMRDCGRHLCGRRCCPGGCSECPNVCGRFLNCQNHHCPAPCHPGDCQRCPVEVKVSCACSASSVAVPCGAERTVPPPPCSKACTVSPTCHHPRRVPHLCHFGPCPPCTQTCSIVRDLCGHVCELPCHSEPPSPDPAAKKGPPLSKAQKALAEEQAAAKLRCPPCPVQVMRQCLGFHETRKVACSSPKEFSCHRLCGNELACGRHTCTNKCHTVSQPRRAESPGVVVPIGQTAPIADSCETCKRPCGVPRPPTCKHGCPAVTCHPGGCPPCGISVTQKCHCTSIELTFECWKLGLPEKELDQVLCCTQQCQRDLPACPHYCRQICHPGACKSEACTQGFQVKCKCGLLRDTWPCSRAQEVRKARAISSKTFATLLECGTKCEEHKAVKGVKQEPEPPPVMEQAPRRRRQRKQDDKRMTTKRSNQLLFPISLLVIVVALVLGIVFLAFHVARS